MDGRLLAWNRRVKPGVLPALWLFTDPLRLPDPLPAIARLPRGRAGVVLRPARGTAPDQAEAVARLCRRRRLALCVAGDWRLAARLRAGLHLRGGSLPAAAPRRLPRMTGSAHDPSEIMRCRRAGVRLIFLSPLFATPSHPGRPGLGVVRWAAWARRASAPGAASRAGALGGIDGRRVASLPPLCRAVGAIGALR